MDTQNNQTENVPTPAPVSCKKHVKDEKATFFANLKEDINVFVHSSWDERKACMQNSLDKMFEKFKTSEEKKAEAKEVPAAVKTPAT